MTKVIITKTRQLTRQEKCIKVVELTIEKARNVIFCGYFSNFGENEAENKEITENHIPAFSLVNSTTLMLFSCRVNCLVLVIITFVTH